MHPRATLHVIGRHPNRQPRTYRLEPSPAQQAAYRRLAVAILGLDVVTLASQLRAAGFQVNHPQVLVLLNPQYDPDAYSVANGEIMADYAVNRGSLTRDQADAWIQDLRQLGRDGQYFFSLNRYLFLATKPAAG